MDKKVFYARNFLQLLDKHFPAGNPLHKLFNRNNVKISYSCLPNVKSIISRHNKRILSSNTVRETKDNCNCRNPDECPLRKNCLDRNIVYEAEVTSDDGEVKKYIGMTANTFKGNRTVKAYLEAKEK